MSITVRLPNGSEVDVPTDDPKQAAAAAQKHWAALKTPKGATPAKPTPPAKRSILQTAGDFVGDTIDNFIPNFGDEIAAIPDAAKALVKGEEVGAAYSKGRKDFKSHQAQYDKEHPWLAWGSTLGGLGASLALPAGRVAEGAGLGVRALHGAAVGAGYGAVSGAGEGDTVSDRGGNALNGAVIGGAAGMAASPLGAVATRIGRNVRQNVPGVEGAARRLGNIPRAVMRRPLVGPGQRAVEQGDRILGREMNRGGIQTGMGQTGAPASPGNILDEVNRRQALGVPAMPADTTEPMRNVTSWASRGMGPGQTRVIQALDRRKAEEASRVRQHVINEFGPVGDPLQQVEQHVRQASDTAAPGYRAAYNQPMVLTPEIEGIMRTPAFQEALPNAVRNIRNAQRDPTELGFRFGQDGTIEGVDTLSTEGFDQVIRAMRDSGRAAMDKTGFRPRDTTDSVHINARARDLRQQLADQNEPYRDVTERYADDMAQRDAFVNGQDVGTLTGHEINAQARAMPQNAQGSWSIGARTALADEASQFGAKYPTGDTAAHIRKSLGDDVKQGAISEMTGNTGAVRGLQDRLEAEHQGNLLWRDVQGNSKTAQRNQLDADMDQAAGGRALSSLTPRGMLASVVNHIASGATAQFRNDVKARIAEVATETNPATVADLMAQIADRAQRDREFASLLHRSGILGAKAYGANIKVEPAVSDDDGWSYNETGTLGVKLGD